MSEEARKAFVGTAQKRMNKAIAAIRAVGDLCSRKGAIGEEDVKAIVERLASETHAAGDRLAAAIDVEPDFRLGGNGEG